MEPSPITTFAPTAFDTVNYRLNYDHSLTPTMLLHLGGAYQTSALDMPSFVAGYNATTQLGLTGPFQPLASRSSAGGRRQLWPAGLRALTARAAWQPSALLVLLPA